MTEIRPAKTEDLDSIQNLAIQLGYNPTKETVMNGLTIMKNNPDYETVVITDGSKVLGWMSLRVCYRVEDISYLEVAALVTEESLRGSGLGKKLMAYAESQAKNKNLQFIGLHSSQHRIEAHRFYEKIGCTKSKESFFFIKTTT